MSFVFTEANEDETKNVFKVVSVVGIRLCILCLICIET